MKLSIEKNVLPFLESGFRVSGCHTQALLSSSIDLKSKITPALFEAFTTVPFGISHVEADPNRLLDCITDPDIGINIACASLGIKYFYKFFKTQEDHLNATQLIIELLKNGPVVLGPLNMGLLPYLKNSQQYIDIDHYIIVESFKPTLEEFTILDPERMGSINIKLKDLIPAWAAIGLREGRGSYIIRQILNVPDKLNWQESLTKLSPQLHNNIDKMSNKFANEFIIFSKSTLVKNQHRSLWNGLDFCLKTRIRRILCCCMFVIKFMKKNHSLKRHLLESAEDAILICQDLIDNLSIEDKIIPTQIYELINTELEFGSNLRKVF